MDPFPAHRGHNDAHISAGYLYIVRLVTDPYTQVTANGGIISSLGTYQAAIVARQWKKNFYVVAEQHKFGRTYPADQFDFIFDQAVIGFRSSSTPPDRMPKEPMPYPIDYTVCARSSSMPTVTCGMLCI